MRGVKAEMVDAVFMPIEGAFSQVVRCKEKYFLIFFQLIVAADFSDWVIWKQIFALS
jgi:hypothetical protein